MSKRKLTVQVNYKSGQSVTFDCDSFSIHENKVEWGNADPAPLWFNKSKVESIWQLRGEE